MRRIALLALLAAFGPAVPAAGHRLAPSLLEVREGDGGHVEVTWRTPLLRPRGSELRPELPAHCAVAGAPSVDRDATSATLRFTADCGAGGLVGSALRIRGLSTGGTDVLVRLELADGRRTAAILSGARDVFPILEPSSLPTIATDYVRLGGGHILGGVDHLLFVLGLLLLVRGWRALLATVTAFTAGHSVTLSLAALGFVAFPSSLVEIAIAASLWWLAVEIARGPEPPSRLRRFPWAVAFAFGLLHGLGFAGALAEIGLPADEIPAALFAFNLGIELGQVLFVAAVLGARSLLRPALLSAPRWVDAVPAYAIGSLGAFFCLDRAVALF